MAVYQLGNPTFSYYGVTDEPISSAGYDEWQDGFASCFCFLCDEVVLPNDRKFVWESSSPHPHITAHANCIARRKDGLIADIQKCCGE